MKKILWMLKTDIINISSRIYMWNGIYYFVGTVDTWARLNIEKESPDVLAMMKFYAALDSCDRELILEEGNKPDICPSVIKIETDDVNGSSRIMTNAVLFFLSLLFFTVI